MAVVSDIASSRESHASLDNLFTYAGASGEGPAGSKPVKALAWLRETNKDPSIDDPLAVVGRIVEGWMEAPLAPGDWLYEERMAEIERLKKVFADAKLRYLQGGRLAPAAGVPSKTLEQFVKERDSSAIEEEFTRALANVDTKPREAVSAASNILESICKTYIAEEGLEMPQKQDLKPVWTVVRKHLGFDPGAIEDTDLQTILSGMISVVDGIGALRTHASSAHGAGVKVYKLEPRHARLAVHAAHTVALFILESWKRKTTIKKPPARPWS
jgi:hypothetical protein